MAQTFSDRIEGFVGTLTMSSVDMEDVLAEEARILYDLATPDMLAKESIYDVRTDSTIGTFTVEDKRIVSVLRNDGSYDRLCAEVAFEMLGPMGDSASIQYAGKRDPVFALQPKQNLGVTERSTGIQVQPTPTATETVKIRYVAYPTSLYGATADNLADFLRKIANPLVYRGCIAEISSRIQVDIAGLATAFYDASGLTPPTSPIANLPSAPLLTFNAVTPTSVVATTIATVTTPIPPSSPSFTYTDASASTISSIDLTNITNLANTLSVPSAPFFTYTDVVSDTYTEADAELDEVDNIIQDLASSSITLPILSVSYADFNTAMTNGDIELAQSYLSQIQTELSEYQAESQTAINEFTALNARRYDSSINHAINKVDAYLKRLQDIASRADSVALQNEAKDLERQVSEYRSDLDRYTQDLNKYQSDVQKLVQATQIELEQLRTNAQLETDVSVQNEARTLEAQISEYQSSLNLYQAELNEHQTEVQKAIAQAQITQERLIETAQRTDNLGIQDEARRLEKEVSEYRLELERFGTEIQTYGQELQSYGLQLQSKVSEANDKMQRKTLEIQSLTADRQYYEGLYAQELQKIGMVQANG